LGFQTKTSDSQLGFDHEDIRLEIIVIIFLIAKELLEKTKKENPLVLARGSQKDDLELTSSTLKISDWTEATASGASMKRIQVFSFFLRQPGGYHFNSVIGEVLLFPPAHSSPAISILKSNTMSKIA